MAGGKSELKYIPPFDVIRRSVEISTVRGELKVTVSYDDFVNIIKGLLAGIEVDEAWYLAEYEDIARAVLEGSVLSARAHFVSDGYFEGRLPFSIAVDEKWYLQQYPDVAAGMQRGSVQSAQLHFAEDGYREGRLPFKV